MNTRIIRLTTLAGLAVGSAFPLAAQAQQEMARVISSTPVMQQVAVPRQVCANTTVVTQAPKSGAGAVMGAIAGGAVGSQIGGGMGNAAATALGVLGGAILGDRIEGAPPVTQPVTTCTEQATYENRIVAYHVTYEYAGKQYSVQMQNDPGQYVPITITPAAAAPAPAQIVTTAPSAPAPVVVAPPVVTTYPPVVVPPPVYPAVVYPPYYGPSWGPYYRPSYGSGITLRWSSGGYGYGHHHHGYGWR